MSPFNVTGNGFPFFNCHDDVTQPYCTAGRLRYFISWYRVMFAIKDNLFSLIEVICDGNQLLLISPWKRFLTFLHRFYEDAATFAIELNYL